ncbi:glycosyltransferase [Microbacterium enclense]|uniref:glycosyltransferase n=1 Tax=Microbacterium enclense TaxID=993073 RepID=UPI0021A8A114|nr:glycosyltransferase [Microbacterium enclense]MCT2086275.1 glycosyltransferase [Microbacterium enclense]
MTAARPTVAGATVTYGSRHESCLAVVGRMLDEGVETVLVIDNGSVPASAARLDAAAAASDGRIVVRRLPRNEGSAPAFGAAIAGAREAGAEYVWLLDDDNLPEPGALDRLLSADRVLRDAGHDLTAVAPLRAADAEPATIAETAAVESARESPREAISFAGVDAGVFARRLLERLRLRRPRPGVVGTDLPYAPYGGLLARADVLRVLGLPRADFVLYGDDLEYTSRISARGGRLGHVRDAVVVDPRGERWMPPGFEVRAMFLSSNPALLYYFLRNRLHRELATGRRWSVARLANAALFLALCVGCALATRRWRPMRVIHRAVGDALAGRLGRRVEI